MNLFEDAPYGLPSFVRERAKPIQKTGFCGQFAFWEPDRTDDEVLDHALGRQHFETAVSFARVLQSNTFLAFVFDGICGYGPGAMERGFIDALAVRATYGQFPAPIPEDEALRLFSACGITAGEVKFGESEAREYLTLARETQCPGVIASLLETIVCGEMQHGQLSFFWTVCGAAYLGALN